MDSEFLSRGQHSIRAVLLCASHVEEETRNQRLLNSDIIHMLRWLTCQSNISASMQKLPTNVACFKE